LKKQASLGNLMGAKSQVRLQPIENSNVFVLINRST